METMGDSFGWLSVLGDRDIEQNEHHRKAEISQKGLSIWNVSTSKDSSKDDDFTDTTSKDPSAGLGFLEVFLNDPNLDQDWVTPHEQECRTEEMPDWPQYAENNGTSYILSEDPGKASIQQYVQNINGANLEDNSQNTSSFETELSCEHHDEIDRNNDQTSESNGTSDTVISNTITHTISTHPTPSPQTLIPTSKINSRDELMFQGDSVALKVDNVARSYKTDAAGLLGTCSSLITDQIEQTSASPSNRCVADLISTHHGGMTGLELYNETVASLLSAKGASTRLLISGVFMWGRLLVRAMDHPFVTSVSGCTSETILFLADRTQDLSDRYIKAITADDPETRHIQRLLLAREAVWGWVHQQSCFLSSLPFHQRQLLKETRDLDRNIEIAIAASLTNLPFKKNQKENDLDENCELFDISDHPNDKHEKESKDIMRKGGGVTDLHNWLVGAAGEGDEEAQYALSRWFTPPTFQESCFCHDCNRPFNTSLFRHHCRCCGHSYCTLHSSQRRSLLRLGLGLISPVRVCDKCAINVDEEIHADNLIWRRLRVEAYLADYSYKNENKTIPEISNKIKYPGCDNPLLDKNQKCNKKVKKEIVTGTTTESAGTGEGAGEDLIPYNGKSVDRGVDKIIRVADYSLQFVKSTVSLNYPTKLALHTMDILKRYGLSGLAGVLLRKVLNIVIK